MSSITINNAFTNLGVNTATPEYATPVWFNAQLVVAVITIMKYSLPGLPIIPVCFPSPTGHLGLPGVNKMPARSPPV